MKEQGTEIGVLLEAGKHNMRRPWREVVYGTLALGGTRLLELINPDLQTRGILPDPFDLPNYAGNFSITTVLAVSAMTGMQDTGRALSQEQFKRERRTRAAVVGGIAIGANALAELVGYGPASTPDPYDFIHGVGAAALVYQGMKPDFMPSREIESYKKTLKDRSKKEGLNTKQETTLKILQTFSRNVRDYGKKPR